MESLFSFLFKYSPFLFSKGSLTFQWTPPWWQVLLAAAVVAAVPALACWRGRGSWTLAAVRATFLILLLTLCLRPSLVLSTLVPRENLLAVVADNSRSMGIPENQAARGRPVSELMGEDSPLLAALDEKFYLRLFRFAARAERVEAPVELDWSGDQTNLAAALRRVLADTRNLPLGGVVLFTDGSDNSHLDFKEVLSELKARQVPVHTVGLGPEALVRDLEITQVAAPRVAIPETVSVARLTIRQRGFGGSRGRLQVREGPSLVHSQEIYVPRDAETFTSEVTFIPKSEGIKTYEFTIEPLEGEEIHQNNSRTSVIDVRRPAARILYVEGHPRWEYKFIRRAVSDDEHIRLETLLRTALNKFYRQGIEEETTLSAGFPTDRGALFEYQGIVFGSVESSFFDYAQMEMVRDFVGKRGGGFLMLGGSASFASGRYQNTPIAEILPVVLRAPEQASGASLYAQGEGQAELTERGRRHPALQLALDREKNELSWSEIPGLIDWNVVEQDKAGATVLARITGGAGEHPLLVFQRYGRGQTLALLTGSSWRWQMLQEHGNQLHQTFWRQLLRWLVATAREPVTVETERDIYTRGETVGLRAEVNDPTYNRINDARVTATITAPDGRVSSLPLEWDARDDGVYRGSWPPDQEGLYRVDVQASGEALSQHRPARGESSFLVSSATREYFDPVQKKEFLQRLSAETGGRYYSIRDVDRLPDEILYTESHSSVVEVLDLWDMPANFMLLAGLLFAEWILRRRQGLI